MPRLENLAAGLAGLPGAATPQVSLWRVWSLHVCFKGRSGYQDLPRFPLFIMNQICICRVPQKVVSPILPILIFKSQFLLVDKVIEKGQEDGIECVILIRRGQKR